MTHKTHDIVATVGTWEDRNTGETKKRYLNVGALMEGDNGPYIMLNRAFNPAGALFKPGSESVLLSCFVPKDDRQSQPRRDSQKVRDEAAYNDALDSEVPF